MGIVRDASYSKVGEINGNIIRDASYSKVGEIDGNIIRDASYSKVGEVENQDDTIGGAALLLLL